MSKARQINFEQAVYDAFGQVKDFTLAVRIAEHFYKQAERDLADAFQSEYAKELARADSLTEEEGFKKFSESVKTLVDAVEGYVAPKKGDKYVFRNEVLAKCNKVKKLLFDE